jgi:tol-pal system protein YbgF
VKRGIVYRGVTAACLVALLATPAFSISKTEQMLIQIQTVVNQLQNDMRDLRSALDERMGMVRQLIEQSTVTVSKLNTAIDAVQRNVQSSVAAQGAKVDQVTTNVQALNDSIEDIRVRLGRLSEQMAAMRMAIETLQTQQAQIQQAAAQAAASSQPGAPGAPGQPAGSGAAPAPPPKELYDNALRDLSSGNTELAMKEFLDYLRYYPDTDLAGNAQFYVGESLYRQKKYREAIDAYDTVLDRYPRGNKAAAARLKKGLSFFELKDRAGGERELRRLMRDFPNSDEAKIAKDYLKSPSASDTSGGRKAPARPVSRRR